MHHARRSRFLAAPVAAILTALCDPEASGQAPCSVDHEFFFGGVTGHFMIGTLTASLTLPRNIITTESPIVLQVELSPPHAEPPEQELMIRSGSESVALRDGAALHVTPRKGERLIFSIATADGKDLCSWQPPVTFIKNVYPIRDTLSPSRAPAGLFGTIRGRPQSVIPHITGEPIGVIFHHTYSDARQEFRLDGAPARILMESPIRFILRDPHPAAGARTLETEGQTDRLHFVDVEKRLVPSAQNRQNLEIRVLGWRPEAGVRWPPYLFILYLNPPAAKLDCGFLHKRREQYEESVLMMSPSLIHDGSFASHCEIRLLQPQPASLRDFFLFFLDMVPGQGLLPFPLPRF